VGAQRVGMDSFMLVDTPSFPGELGVSDKHEAVCANALRAPPPICDETSEATTKL